LIALLPNSKSFARGKSPEEFRASIEERLSAASI
jgi:hypothetical protein